MTTATRSHYDLLGGEVGVLQLVNRFYDLMDELPEAYELRKIHPQDSSESRAKLFKFLSGWLGGPGLYEAEYGHPRLRQRHFPFQVNSQMRDQWIMCMDLALDEQSNDELLKLQLKQAITRLADHMRNTAD